MAKKLTTQHMSFPFHFMIFFLSKTNRLSILWLIKWKQHWSGNLSMTLYRINLSVHKEWILRFVQNHSWFQTKRSICWVDKNIVESEKTLICCGAYLIIIIYNEVSKTVWFFSYFIEADCFMYNSCRDLKHQKLMQRSKAS